MVIYVYPLNSRVISLRSLIKLCQIVDADLTALLGRHAMPVLGRLKVFFQAIRSQTVIVPSTILRIRFSLFGCNGDLLYCDEFQYIGSFIRSVI